MSKNIVICLDGTGNQFKDDNSNVVKFYRVLERKPEEQVVYYDAGVGTLADPAYKTPLLKRINKIFGLAFGHGMTKDIKEAYLFLMDNYNTGDNVFIFGFSRGAYTARALAGLVHCVGVLEKGNQSLIPYAIKLFKAKNIDWNVLAKFKHTFGRACEIKFLGLWDTVSSLGWVYDPILFPYTVNNKSVKAVRHAIAIDEKRTLFLPLLWGKKFCEEQDIKEVWFAGVHSDVGGGYSELESGLAKIPLKWMIDEATSKFGLKKDDYNYKRYVLGLKIDNKKNPYTKPNSYADMHNSLKGLWKIVQYLPLSAWNDKKKRKNIVIPKRFRDIPDDAILHDSVHKRINNNIYVYDPYKPYKPSNVDLENLHKYREKNNDSSCS